MQAYSLDLRKRILEDLDHGITTREVALKYRVSESWIRRLKQRRRETGEIAPRRSGSRRTPKWLAAADRIKQLVQEQPDLTLRELKERLGLNISIPTLARALWALRLTFKKKSFAPRNRIGRTSKSGGHAGRPK